MIAIARIKSAVVTAGKRVLQSLVLGNTPYQADEYGPFGLDSSPIKDTKAVFSDTSARNKQVILGYENKQQKAVPGESRLYAVNESGNVVFNIWLKSDGTILIGQSDNPGDYSDAMVRYKDLNTSIQNNIVTFINAELGKIANGISGAGGTYVPGTMSVDITGAKAETIKCQ